MDTKTINVLLVEDEPLIQKAHQMHLQNLGWGTDLAENGKQALRLFEESKTTYDVILLDIGLPDIDGIEVARIIREKNKPIPLIIALTAFLKEDFEKKGMEAGINKIFSKPVDFEKLEKFIQSAL